MDIGVAVFPTDRSWAIDELAEAAEARGFASLAVTEHTHMPLDHSPYPAGGPLPEEYRRTLDPVVALTVAAGATSTLRLTFGICLVAQHDPIVLAKAVASLDVVSGGRVEFGVGYGWNRPELEHHGVAWADRRSVVRERLEAMRRLWTQDEAGFEGSHVRLSPSWSWPKPVQRPHPPIVLGAGLGPRTLDDVVAVTDGWMPIGAHATSEGMPRLQEAWAAAGRPGRPRVHVLGANPARLGRLRDLGVDAVTLWLPAAAREETLPVLDAHARTMEALHEGAA